MIVDRNHYKNIKIIKSNSKIISCKNRPTTSDTMRANINWLRPNSPEKEILKNTLNINK